MNISDPTAGLTTEELNNEKRMLEKIQLQNQIAFQKMKEFQLKARKNLQIKDHNYYNKRDNLWNEPEKLSPNLAKYSHLNINPKDTFKKTIRNLEKVE